MTRGKSDELTLTLVRIRRIAEHNRTLAGALQEEILNAHREGGTIRQIGEAALVGRETVRRIIKQAESA